MKKEELLTIGELLPILELEAVSKGVQVFHIKNEELQKDFNVKGKDIDVLVLSKTEKGARFNLLNMRHSYLIINK